MDKLPDIPVVWIEDLIKSYVGIEHAMWSKLLRLWETEQLRKTIREMCQHED